MKVHYSSKTHEWETPGDLFDKLNKKFNFTLDPCCTLKNKKCEKYYTVEDDGLSCDWSGERVFMNPPYGREIGKWVEKAYMSNALVIALLPARTDTKWFHDYIYYGKSTIKFLKGRLKFGNCKNSAPFPSMIVGFWRLDID